MKYKKVLLPPEPYYSGRVTRYPDRKVAFESGLRWHGSYEISYIKKGKVIDLEPSKPPMAGPIINPRPMAPPRYPNHLPLSCGSVLSVIYANNAL